MSGPRVSSGPDSVQVVGTPWEFIHAVERRWGKIVLDLAATAENAKAAHFITEEMDSLRFHWCERVGNLWLNPPFSDIAPWARKCSEESEGGARIFFLVPASIDSNWWANYVHDHACVLPIHPRLKFEGHKDLYPKTLALVLYGVEPVGYPGRWLWKESKQHESLLAL